jgi:two-component system, LytTR family, response regulator
MMISAIHIEDEPRNVELLENLVKTHCGDTVQLCGNAGNTKDAIALIKAKKPQLVYLDIELNRGNAFELLEKLNEQHAFNFQVIFITAFNEYAVKAFRYNALDYLLKPISIDELKEATTKAVNKISQLPGNENVLEAIRQLKLNYNSPKIGLPVIDGIAFINSDEIIRAEAKGSYSIFYLANGEKITSTKSLKDVEHMLPEASFLRVHHSWIINIKFLKKYYRGKNGYMEMEDGSMVMVSIRKKGKFLDSF